MYLKVGRCEFCNTYLVVMDTQTGSVLPIEVESKNVGINSDEIFDSKVHKSHLINCAKQREAWDKKKLKYIKARNPFNKI